MGGLPWHIARPEQYAAEVEEVRQCFPHLHFHASREAVMAKGTFPVIHDGVELARYSVHVMIPGSYPQDFPLVYETGGRIPRELDYHISKEGLACLFLPELRTKVFPVGAPLLDFFTGPVYQYFLGQALVERGEQWPFGEWRHGADGTYDYYSDRLNTNDIHTIIRYIEALATKKQKGYKPCPCGNEKKLRECHGFFVHKLRMEIPYQVARHSLELLRKTYNQA